jgi:hypothetical protein
VTYYDVHGRPICIDKQASRALFVADETDAQFDHIEGEPQI